MAAIRTQARAALGAYQRANAYASAQVAFGRLYKTLGFDPIADGFEAEDLPKLTERVRQHLRDTEQGNLSMKSTLFGQLPLVSVRFAGVRDVEMQERMKTQISDLLKRNEIAQVAANGMPLTFVLTRNAKSGLEAAQWNIELSDAQGKSQGATQYATTMPLDARNSTYESSVIAATIQALPKMRAWLAAVAPPAGGLRE